MFKIWLAIVILLTIVEIMTTNLTTIWFVVSALVALFVSFIIKSFMMQFTIFVMLGIVLLITTRPILTRLLQKEKERTNIDRIIGMRGIVVDDILEKEFGAVKVDGKIWTAYSEQKIDKNKYVTIMNINGNKLKVEEE